MATMTTEQVLRALRRRIQEVDESVSDVTDEELLDALIDARRQLVSNKVTGISTLVIVRDQYEDGYGIAPDPSEEIAELLILQAAVSTLEQMYYDRLRDGELGVSWTSGLESESSIQSEKAYKGLIQQLRNRLDQSLLIYEVNKAGARMQ